MFLFMWTSVLLCPQLCATLVRLLSNMTWDDWARSWPSPEPGTAGASPGASFWETRPSTFQVPGWESLRFSVFDWFGLNKHQHWHWTGLFLYLQKVVKSQFLIGVCNYNTNAGFTMLLEEFKKNTVQATSKSILWIVPSLLTLFSEIAEQKCLY